MRASTALAGILMCAVVSTLATGQAAANLLTNAGFETGDLTGWLALNTSGSANVTVQTPDNGPSGAGTHNAFEDNQSEALGLTLQQTTANGTAAPGRVYYSFDLKLGQAALGGVFFVEIFAQNAVGAVIGNAGLLGNYSPANWTTYSGSFVAPANTDHLTIQFEANTGAIHGSKSSMHVDNVDVNQGAVSIGPGAGLPPAALRFASVAGGLARGSAELTFSLPERGHVDLAVFDMSGRSIHSLASGSFDAGTHSATWNLRNADGRLVAPGVYLARMNALGHSLVRKIVVAR